MSDCGKAVWCELLCSEESESAGLRHARLVWDRGWLSSGRSPFLPVHSPAPSAHFHGTQGVALSSVLTHQPPHAHLWAAHTVSALPVRAPSLPDAAAAAVTTRVKEKRSSGTKKTRTWVTERDRQEWGFSVSGGGEKTKISLRYCSRRRCCSPGSPEWYCVGTGQVSAASLWKRSRSQCWDTWRKQRWAGFQWTAPVQLIPGCRLQELSERRSTLKPDMDSRSTTARSLDASQTVLINLSSCPAGLCSAYFPTEGLFHCIIQKVKLYYECSAFIFGPTFFLLKEATLPSFWVWEAHILSQ